MPTSMRSERRRYFRIEDRVLISYRVVPAQPGAREPPWLDANDLPPANLQAALQPLETRLQDLLPMLRSEDRALAEAIDVLNRKLNLLAQAVVRAGPDPDRGAGGGQEAAVVSLSGGGIGLPAAEALAPDTPVALELVLLPGRQFMRMMGRVVACRDAAPGGCIIAIEFDRVREQEREMLVQHIARRQLANLRRQRRPAENGGV